VHWLRIIFIFIDTVIVKSDGLTDASPHCSWLSDCEYTEATKNECADALCKAQGFIVGKFLESSNNFCTDSFTDDSCYVYILENNQIEYEQWPNEAQITAECQSGYQYHNGTYCSGDYVDGVHGRDTLEEAVTGCNEDSQCGCFFYSGECHVEGYCRGAKYFLRKGTETNDSEYGSEAWVS